MDDQHATPTPDSARRALMLGGALAAAGAISSASAQTSRPLKIVLHVSEADAWPAALSNARNLSAKYPGVKVTQTVGLPDDMLGELVVACIVPHEGATVEESGLRDFLKERLASYKIPRRVLFFREDEMSLTGSGAKIKAGEVRKLAADRLGIQTQA